MTGWLSTWRVALPPLRVKRTTWYLPSFTTTAGSSMVMSSVPTLKMTPIFPWSCWRKAENECHAKKNKKSSKLKIFHILFIWNVHKMSYHLLQGCWARNGEIISFVTWTVCLVLSLGFSSPSPLQPAQVSWCGSLLTESCCFFFGWPTSLPVSLSVLLPTFLKGQSCFSSQPLGGTNKKHWKQTVWGLCMPVWPLHICCLHSQFDTRSKC